MGEKNEKEKKPSTLFNVLEKLIIVALIAYFLYKVIGSSIKLREAKIGTSLTTEITDTVEFPTFTICFYRNVTRHKAFNISDENFKFPESNPDLYRMLSGVKFPYVNSTGGDTAFLFSNGVSAPRTPMESVLSTGLLTTFYAIRPMNKILMDCVKIDPPGHSRVGELFPVTLALNATDVAAIELYLHNKRQMVVPDKFLSYGSIKIYTMLDKDTLEKPPKTVYSAAYDLFKTEIRGLPQEHKPCDEREAAKVDLFKCFAEYVEGSVGCRTNMHETNTNLSVCSGRDKLDKLLEVTGAMERMTEIDLYHKTKCLASCTKNDYKKETVIDVLQQASPVDYTVVSYAFLYSTSEQGIKEEYIIYDFDSFIADVGGFLGLLLGHSLLSIYQSMHEWNKKGKMCGCMK